MKISDIRKEMNWKIKAGGLGLASLLYFSNPGYSENKAKSVYIAPGHDKRFPGSDGLAGSEAEIACKIASKLENKLKIDPGLEVFVTRTENGEYNPELTGFIEAHYDLYEKIIFDNFISTNTTRKYKNIRAFKRYLDSSNELFDRENPHYKFMLLGIADYANTMKFDAMVSIHLNKADKKKSKKPEGFVIFYSRKNQEPEKSKLLAYSIYKRIKKDFKASNNPGETEGVVERDDLLLVNVEIPSVLIECGYIDEIKFKNPIVLDKIINNLDRGIIDYLRKE